VTSDTPTEQRDALDGLAAAGTFGAVFGGDVSAVTVVCGGCGNGARFADQRAYMTGPGVVLRCRSCAHILARVVTTPTDTWVTLAGSQSWRLGRS
jgi:hypothetical protein